MEENKPVYLSYEDLAERWGLGGTKYPRRLVKEGALQGWKFGREVRVTLADVIEFEKTVEIN